MAKDTHLPKVRCEKKERDLVKKAAKKLGETASKFILDEILKAAKRVLRA